MRVSSVIHETSAEHHLMMLQQIEPETYDKLTKRLGGVSTYSKLLQDVRVKELPSMFSSWEEYDLYLINNIIESSNKAAFREMIKSLAPLIKRLPSKKEEAFRCLCPIILANDFGGSKFANLREKLKMKYKYDIK
jgi:predicted phosphoadenosine phosphosulfate sulfurtransferase